MDFEKFRLRRFIDRLIELGEVEIHDEPVPLAGLSAIIEASPKATLFKKAGPERLELVATVWRRLSASTRWNCPTNTCAGWPTPSRRSKLRLPMRRCTRWCAPAMTST